MRSESCSRGNESYTVLDSEKGDMRKEYWYEVRPSSICKLGQSNKRINLSKKEYRDGNQKYILACAECHVKDPMLNFYIINRLAETFDLDSISARKHKSIGPKVQSPLDDVGNCQNTGPWNLLGNASISQYMGLVHVSILDGPSTYTISNQPNTKFFISQF
jgi:hypothetical protein